MEIPTFSEEDLVELEILRYDEIDALAHQGFISTTERWDPELHNGFVFTYPEMTLEITTGKWYPVQPLEYHLKNIYLPRMVIDDLRVALRPIFLQGCQTNTLENWSKRRMANSHGIFEYDKIVLNIVAKTVAHLVEYRSAHIVECRSNPTKSRSKTKAGRHFVKDKRMTYERLGLLESMGGIDLFTNPKFNQLKWSGNDAVVGPERMDITSAQSRKDIIDSELGLDPSSVVGHDFANTLLGKTPEQICAKVPKVFRILHIECVLRSDLSRAFLGKQDQLRKKLVDYPLERLRGTVPVEIRRELRKRGGREEKESLADFLVEPRLTFHGTRKDHVASIVRQGFLIPDKSEVRCGSTYGRGIYSSPDAEFALCYTGYDASPTGSSEFAGLKLIVCATIMGVSSTMYREDDWKEQTEPYPGADSHVANREYEYIVFDQAQIIPCYVIHLDLGRDIAKYFENVPNNPRAWIDDLQPDAHSRRRLRPQAPGPGDERRIKKALIAKASKYFSYGYGPVSGSKIVIEGVGEVDEDEEEYGEYQRERVDGIEGHNDIWTWDDDTTFAVDEVGDGVEDDEMLSDSPADKAEEDEDEDDEAEDNYPKWGYGVKGKSKFDEYYFARIAKNKRVERPHRAGSP